MVTWPRSLSLSFSLSFFRVSLHRVDFTVSPCIDSFVRNYASPPPVIISSLFIPATVRAVSPPSLSLLSLFFLLFRFTSLFHFPRIFSFFFFLSPIFFFLSFLLFSRVLFVAAYNDSQIRVKITEERRSSIVNNFSSSGTCLHM